jgi:hypothetical protein
VRDTDTLDLLSGFILSDVIIYILKYKVLSFALSKDGVQQDPGRAAYCRQRFDRGCASVNRYLLGFQLGLKQEMANA